MNNVAYFMNKTKTDSLFGDSTEASATDSEMIGYINEKEELFEQEYGCKDYVYSFTGKTIRNNIEGQQFISLAFASKVVVEMFKRNFCILFVDG